MDGVLINKAASVERCIKRIKEEYVDFETLKNAVHEYSGINLEVVDAIIQHHLSDILDFSRIVLKN